IVTIGKLAGELADANPDGLDRNAADTLRGTGLLLSGRFEEAAPLLRTAIEVGATSENLDEILLAARTASVIGDDPTAIGYCQRALRLARERGAIGALPRILERAPLYGLRLGRLSEARLHASEGLQLARELGQEPGNHLCVLAFLGAVQGREEECRTYAAQA